jgi:hypothetical protein
MPPAPVRVPIQWPIAPIVTSVCLSDNDKGDCEVKPGVMHKYYDIYLMTNESSVEPHLGDNLNAVQPVIALNWIPYFQMTSLGTHSTSERERGGGKESPHTSMSQSFIYLIFISFIYLISCHSRLR